jgi:hypothetical protein
MVAQHKKGLIPLPVFDSVSFGITGSSTTPHTGSFKRTSKPVGGKLLKVYHDGYDSPIPVESKKPFPFFNLPYPLRSDSLSLAPDSPAIKVFHEGTWYKPPSGFKLACLAPYEPDAGVSVKKSSSQP